MRVRLYEVDSTDKLLLVSTGDHTESFRDDPEGAAECEADLIAKGYHWYGGGAAGVYRFERVESPAA
jgi:hypothetical protein